MNDFLLKLEGFKYVASPDLSTVYYHIQLSEDTSNLCKSVLAFLSQIMAENLDGPISHAPGWVNDQITIVVALLYSLIIFGA